jgi:hypothetical protein
VSGREDDTAGYINFPVRSTVLSIMSTAKAMGIEVVTAPKAIEAPAAPK